VQSSLDIRLQRLASWPRAAHDLRDRERGEGEASAPISCVCGVCVVCVVCVCCVSRWSYGDVDSRWSFLFQRERRLRRVQDNKKRREETRRDESADELRRRREQRHTTDNGQHETTHAQEITRAARRPEGARRLHHAMSEPREATKSKNSAINRRIGSEQAKRF
jgi:hypothetical protein